MKLLTMKNDNRLYRGIFWIIDIDNIMKSKTYFLIPCDSDGNINDPEFHISSSMSSVGTDNYNHKKVWSCLPRSMTHNKPFDYYPRGRVEIANGIAKVYHSAHIPQDELKQFVIDKFNLTSFNGIKKIKMIADGSDHYKCYLDFE